MDTALTVRQGEKAAPPADYSGECRVLCSSSMRARRSLSVAGVLVAAGLAGACREAPAPRDGKSGASATIASARSLSVGDLAPEFSLPGSDGKQYSLASYRGRQAVVLAWFTHAFSEG
jgi:AhpC/TSA family protein